MILWGRYLRSTDRSDVADAADKVAEYLTGDEEVANPELYFDQVIEINLSNWSRI
jgi:aconitate hydratase